MKKYRPLLILVLSIVLTGCAEKEVVQKQPIEIILDVKPFAGLSEQELIAKMGEPDLKEEWSYEKEGMVYPITSLTYENNRFEFLLNNGLIHRISIHADSYNIADGAPFSFDDKEDILSMFGITPEDVKHAKKTDTNSALRYENFGKILSFWIPSYEDTTFDEVKIDFSDLF